MKNYFYLIIFILFISCDSDSNSLNSNANSSSSETGQGGSLARFTVLNNYLYTVDNRYLHVFNIANEELPVQVNSVEIGFNIETLFNYKEYLYMGSRNGMYIYGIQNPETPQYLSDVQHFTACDPVIANEQYAFVTLKGGNICGTNFNKLEVYNVTDIVNPVLVSERNLTGPVGIGLFNNYLFVCDDEVKIFDVNDPENSVLVTSIDRSAFDVIIQDDLLILIGSNGLYQYRLDENDIENIQELSTVDI